MANALFQPLKIRFHFRFLPLAVITVGILLRGQPVQGAILYTQLATPLTMANAAGGYLVFSLDDDFPAFVAGSNGYVAPDVYSLSYIPQFGGFQITGSESSALSIYAGSADGYPATTLFQAGATISGSTSFYSVLNAHGPAGAWMTPGTTGYVGLAPNGGANFGWALISYNLDDSITLYSYAIDSTGGESITGGETSTVPEPGLTTLLAASGILAAACLGRRRSVA